MKMYKNEKPSVTIGGITIPLTLSIVLTASASASTYDTLRKNGVQYQVPAGYKLVLLAVRLYTVSAVVAGLTLGYGDTATVSAAPTNPVTIQGGGANSQYCVHTQAIAGSYVEAPIYAEIPAGKYPYFLAVNVGYTVFLAQLVAV